MHRAENGMFCGGIMATGIRLFAAPFVAAAAYLILKSMIFEEESGS